MKNVLGPFIFSLFLLFGLNIDSAYAQKHNNTISGHVFSNERRAVPDIYVELKNETNATIARVKTDGSGGYFFPGLSGGSFTIRVLPYGTNLDEQTAEVNIGTDGISGRSPSENVQQDFTLRLRKSSDSSDVNGIVFAQEIPGNAKKLYENAVASLENKKVDVGIAELESAVAAFPTYYSALLRLGQEYLNKENWELSYNVFKKVIEVNPRSYNGWHGLSHAAFGVQKFDVAVTAGQKSVEIMPESVDAFLFLGISQRRAKQFLDAEKSLKRGEKLAKGKSPDIHWNLALLYAYNLTKYEAAAEQLELYLKAKPELTEAETIKKLIVQFREKALAAK